MRKILNEDKPVFVVPILGINLLETQEARYGAKYGSMAAVATALGTFLLTSNVRKAGFSSVMVGCLSSLVVHNYMFYKKIEEEKRHQAYLSYVREVAPNYTVPNAEKE